MNKSSQQKPADFITPLLINGLEGRVLHMPAPATKKRDILFIYGHHSTLERWWGMVQDLNQYGSVTVPDLPGFGGMDSFYKIGLEPTIDNLADYLATFVKLRYRRKKVTLCGLSFGFVVVTRMLQRNPELIKKVDILVSVVGFSHHGDFVFSPNRSRFYRIGTKALSHKVPSIVFKNLFLNPTIVRLAYAKTFNAKKKFENLSKQDRKASMDFEVHLWHKNDIRTQALTSYEFFLLDNCKVKINLPVWHVSVKADRYFDNHTVEQHMRVIFSDFHEAKSNSGSHAPSILADKEAASKIMPASIRKILSED